MFVFNGHDDVPYKSWCFSTLYVFILSTYFRLPFSVFYCLLLRDATSPIYKIIFVCEHLASQSGGFSCLCVVCYNCIKKRITSPLPCEIGRNEKSIAIFFTFTVPSPCLLNVNVNLMTTKCSTNSFLLRIHFIVCSHLLPYFSYFYVHVFAPYFSSFHLDIAKLYIDIK